MANSYKFADDHLDGGLEARLRSWRAQGDSFDMMSRKLERLNVPASREQVRRWCKALNIPTMRVVKEDV